MTKEEIIAWFKDLQDTICNGLEKMDSQGKFHQDLWARQEGGGGRTRILMGAHIEKGGVNFSAVHGQMPENIAKALLLPPNQFTASGVSIVLHPVNPWVPIIHMNVRYFETDSGNWWFGGGIDATPHIVIPSDAKRFHEGLKAVCDAFHPTAYSAYKKWADDYFYIPHRNETRGIGGIFFDRLNESRGHTKKECWNFVQNVGEHFLLAYDGLFTHNYQKVYSKEDKNWQLLRRSRYVEFNLVYDKGTKFGLQTNGRIESILMSMPPQANWEYDHHPSSNSIYAKTQSFLKKDINWINRRSK